MRFSSLQEVSMLLIDFFGRIAIRQAFPPPPEKPCAGVPPALVRFSLAKIQTGSVSALCARNVSFLREISAAQFFSFFFFPPDRPVRMFAFI